MTTPHTPEPWPEPSQDTDPDSADYGWWFVSGPHLMTPEQTDAQRAVTCVNACKDIADPEAEIRKMREIVAMAAAHQCLDIDAQNRAECRVRGANPDFYCLSCLAKHTLKNV